MVSKPEWLKHFRILCCEQQNCPNWKLEKHKIFTGLPLYCSSAIKAVKMSFCICSPRNWPPHPLCASLLWHTWAKCWSIKPLSERLRGISRVLLCTTISCVQCLGCRAHLSNRGWHWWQLIPPLQPTATHPLELLPHPNDDKECLPSACYSPQLLQIVTSFTFYFV